MTENERELLTLIRENENPEQALLIAMQIVVDFLEKHGLCPELPKVCD